jgi:RNA polymerase sigma-70 factor (ECF subfamily)
MIEAMTAPIEDVNARCVLDAWRQHEGELLGYLLHRLGNRDEAEDLLQEVFAKALLQGRAFCSLENPRAWLFQVARNAHVDRLRLAKSNVELPENLAQPAEEQPAIEKLTECLPRVLSEMSDEDREIITMCDVEGLSQQAYADLIGVTLPAAKARIQRARLRLRSFLVEKCQVSFDEQGQVCCHVSRGAS